jgi:hypothetical protein
MVEFFPEAVVSTCFAHVVWERTVMAVTDQLCEVRWTTVTFSEFVETITLLRPQNFVVWTRHHPLRPLSLGVQEGWLSKQGGPFNVRCMLVYHLLFPK